MMSGRGGGGGECMGFVHGGYIHGWGDQTYVLGYMNFQVIGAYPNF